jgi:hypothetical protein
VIDAPLTFDAAVAAFATAVRHRDAAGSPRCFERTVHAFHRAGDAELHAGGPLLAAVLPHLPPGPRSTAAVLVGACVERGADPVRCAPPVLDAGHEALAAALGFVRAWQREHGGPPPDPEEGEPSPQVLDRFGAPAVVAWWTARPWETACVAMLGAPAVRAGLPRRAERLRLARELDGACGGGFRSLLYALLLPDGEPLVVLHRRSRTGWMMRMHGIGDVFQLHTLLADVLIGGGRLPGEAPSAEAVAVCRTEPGQVTTSGAFDLVAADGSRLWNEGSPGDIPPVDGARVLVVDPPAYQRSWPAGRFFPGVPGDLSLERPLTPAETDHWFARVVAAG